MKYYKQITTGLMCALLGAMQAFGAGGVKIDHLGVDNTLVRINDKSKFLLLPVEDSVEDAKIDLLLNGKPETTFYVKLARNKVDFYVPLDISRYGDDVITLNVVTEQSRSNVRETKDDACWKMIKLSDDFDTTNREMYRPAYHHTPLWGWMNDPNGMFYQDGVWHLYYQYNPYGSKWQNMTWGHSTSTDLINWEHHPNAIEPDGLGSIFSGSCVVDKNNTAGYGNDAIIALYTSAGRNQMQSLASSTDNGETFVTYDGNPIITLETEARDPNMFWNEETKEWNLLLAHALDHEMLVFTSPDLKTWTLQSSFGKGLGAQDGVWECPDLLELPVKGTNEKKWVLICNLNPGGIFGGSATQYFVGDFDGKTFTVDTAADGTVPTKWMDYGKDHYATVSWSNAPDDRNVVIGWMSNWQYAAEVPTKQYRSANTLPRDVSLFKGADGDYYLASAPSPEILGLRDKKVLSKRSNSFGKSGAKYNLPADGLCEIDVTLNAGKNNSVKLQLSNVKGEKVDMIFNSVNHTFSFDRTQSGLTDFSQDFPVVTVAPTFSNSNSVSLRIFIDKSSIEVFGDDGHFAMTNLVFPTEPYTTMTISAGNGKASLSNLEVYSIKK